jgi:hypothetical protein
VGVVLDGAPVPEPDADRRVGVVAVARLGLIRTARQDVGGASPCRPNDGDVALRGSSTRSYHELTAAGSILRLHWAGESTPPVWLATQPRDHVVGIVGPDIYAQTTRYGVNERRAMTTAASEPEMAPYGNAGVGIDRHALRPVVLDVEGIEYAVHAS